MIRLLAVVVLLLAATAHAGKARLKDVATPQGMRDNQLFGYGLVIGLSGTGDSDRVFFTSQSISGMLARLGIRVDAREVRSRNVAAVMVTAKLPTYSRPGQELDVAVASIGNARSLAGGILLITPLAGADGQVYAVAQGGVQVGGFEAEAIGNVVRKNQTTSGRVPQGATVEKSVTPAIPANGPVLLALRRPDLSTAVAITKSIDGKYGAGTAKALDPAAIEITPPENFKAQPLLLLAELEKLEVDVDQRAKVVVNERTGTVVAGENVRLRPAAVAHGGLQVNITSQPLISQPGAFSGGTTVVVPRASIEATEKQSQTIALKETSTVEDLTKALNALGASPRDLVSILQALHVAGALDADLEVM